MNRYCSTLFNPVTFIGQQALFSSFFSFKVDDYCVEKTDFHPIDGHECYKADQPYSIHCHECDKANQPYSIHCHECDKADQPYSIHCHECDKADQSYSIHCHECDKADQLYSIHCHEYVDIVLKSSLLKCFLFNYINLNTKIL